MGRTGAVHRHGDRHNRLLLVAAVREYVLPFAAAFVLCAVAFLGLDVAIMALQGLSLIFQP